MTASHAKKKSKQNNKDQQFGSLNYPENNLESEDPKTKINKQTKNHKKTPKQNKTPQNNKICLRTKRR